VTGWSQVSPQKLLAAALLARAISVEPAESAGASKVLLSNTAIDSSPAKDTGRRADPTLVYVALILCWADRLTPKRAQCWANLMFSFPTSVDSVGAAPLCECALWNATKRYQGEMGLVMRPSGMVATYGRLELVAIRARCSSLMLPRLSTSSDGYTTHAVTREGVDVALAD